jgi:hypothetical protein
MLSIPLIEHYLQNLTDGEIYPAYDIIGQILKMKKAAIAKGSCNSARLMCGDCEMHVSGIRTSADVDHARVYRVNVRGRMRLLRSFRGKLFITRLSTDRAWLVLYSMLRMRREVCCMRPPLVVVIPNTCNIFWGQNLSDSRSSNLK